MIGKIKGTLEYVFDGNGLIETASGVSYLVRLPTGLLQTQPPQAIELITYLHVREDALLLFGFSDWETYRIFSLLIEVNGVGTKTAFNIVNTVKSYDIYEAIRGNDLSFFTKIPGLGQKTAAKIILELGHKLTKNINLNQNIRSSADQEFIDAMMSLGFRAKDVEDVLTKLDAKLSFEDKVRQALSILGKT